MKTRIIVICIAFLTLTISADCSGQESKAEDAAASQREKKSRLQIMFQEGAMAGINDERLEKLRELLQEKSDGLLSKSERLGPDHPDLSQLRQQIAEIELKLGRSIEPDAADAKGHVTRIAHALQQQMQQMADTMESLGRELERLEKLENQFHSEAVPSRKDFFESAEKLFLSGRKYFGELEQATEDSLRMNLSLLGVEQDPLISGNSSRSNLPAVQLAANEAQLLAKTKAEESRQRAVEAYLAASSAAGSLAKSVQPANERLEKMEERLSRIESMLEKLIGDKVDDD